MALLIIPVISLFEDYSGGEGEDEVMRAIETSAHHIDVVAKNPPPVFTELLELTTYADGFQEWKEVARCVLSIRGTCHFSRPFWQ